MGHPAEHSSFFPISARLSSKAGVDYDFSADRLAVAPGQGCLSALGVSTGGCAREFVTEPTPRRLACLCLLMGRVANQWICAGAANSTPGDVPVHSGDHQWRVTPVHSLDEPWTPGHRRTGARGPGKCGCERAAVRRPADFTLRRPSPWLFREEARPLPPRDLPLLLAQLRGGCGRWWGCRRGGCWSGLLGSLGRLREVQGAGGVGCAGVWPVSRDGGVRSDGPLSNRLFARACNILVLRTSRASRPSQNVQNGRGGGDYWRGTRPLPMGHGKARMA